MSKNNKSRNGIGFFGMLLILIIGLKLANFITWSWWWILSPFWLPPFLFVVGVIGWFAVMSLKKR